MLFEPARRVHLINGASISSTSQSDTRGEIRLALFMVQFVLGFAGAFAGRSAYDFSYGSA